MRCLLVVLLAIVLAGCRAGVDDPGEPGAVSPPLGSEGPRGSETDRFLVAVGDIACAPGEPETARTCHQAGTAALLERGGPLGGEGLVAALLLGDTQYETGTVAEYRSFDDTWGRVLGRTDAAILPVTGNHEYEGSGDVPAGCRLLASDRHACGFASYFGERTDLLDDGDAQYAMTFGEQAPHPLVVIVLDTGRCEVAPSACEADGPVVGFLQDALRDPRANPPAACTIVAWHQARWSELGHGDLGFVDPIWRALFQAPGAQRPDLVLNGHDHLYERYPPLGVEGSPDPRGIAEIVAGTGGKDIVGGTISLPPFGDLAALDTSAFGVLRVDWSAARGAIATSFVTEAGEARDRWPHPCNA